jgi:hypothetical protein
MSVSPHSLNHLAKAVCVYAQLYKIPCFRALRASSKVRGGGNQDSILSAARFMVPERSR